ncbi:MAG: hypothetical protein ACK5AZ_14080 [Bryobacteraceae bacterium]
MNRTGKLQLELVDVFGDRLAERVSIVLQHQGLSDRRVVRGIDARKRITVIDLYATPQGLYRVEIDPPSYRTVSQFVNLPAVGAASRRIVFPIDPGRVTAVSFPDYVALQPHGRELLERSSAVLGHEGRSGQVLYAALDDVRRAGFLNIVAKCARTMLSTGCTVLSHLVELRELRGDRFFVKVPHQLREDVVNSVATGAFYEVNGVLHRPPDGYTRAGSYKTPDRYGNLQLTFFAGPNDWEADVDIDDAAGLEHVFQVLRNELTRRPTHPYDIHQILIRHQELDPGYRFHL